MSTERPAYSAPTELVLGRLFKSLYHAQGDIVGAAAYAEGQHENWKNTPQLYTLLKGAVSAVQTGNATDLTFPKAIFDFYLPLLRARTLIDRVPGWRRVDANVSVLRYTSDATAGVVTEGAAILVSKFALERVTLGIRKIAGLVLATRETLEMSGGIGQSSLATELAGAIGSATDRQMFNVDVATSIAATGTIINSAGTSLANIDSDIKLALATFNAGDAALDRVVALMSPQLATFLGSLRGTGGENAFENVGPRGGTIVGPSGAGIPVYVSGALAGVGSPGASQLTFVDPQQVLVSDPRAAEIAVTTSASIQMDDAATQSSATPTATTLVSLFQTGTAAVAGVRWVDWLLSRTVGCATIANIAV